LLATAGILAGAGTARNHRSALDRVFLQTVPAVRAAPPASLSPPITAAPPVAAAPLASVSAPDDKPTLHDVILLVEESRAALEGVRDYTAEFSKDERLNGRVRTQVMEMKLRERPFSVYLRYRSKKEAGRQAVFVEGQDFDSLVVRDVGLRGALGTLKLNLQNPMVTCENRHPVTELGISKVVETALVIWKREEKLPGTRPIVSICPSTRFAGADCCQVQVRYETRCPELEFQRASVWFDNKTKLPVHAERYGWVDDSGGELPLIEAYTYTDVKTNVGLTDADFEPQRYGF
jgi:hypothetical protein